MNAPAASSCRVPAWQAWRAALVRLARLVRLVRLVRPVRLGGLARLAPLACLGWVACLTGCPIVDDDALPGAPCDDARDCPSGFACSEDTCVPASDVEPPVGCIGKADGDACSDGDPCTEGDACLDAVCAGAAIVCGDVQVCSGGLCVDLGECTLAGALERVTNTPGVSAAVSLAYDPGRDQLAVAFDDDVTGRSEVFVQLLAGATAEPIGPAVQVSDGTPRDADDVEHPSFQPSIVFNAEQNEFAVAWSSFGFGLLFVNPEVFVGTVTTSGVPASTHDVLASFSAFSMGGVALVATGVGYGVAWVDDRNSTADVVTSDLFFARLEDDASPSSFTNQRVSPSGEIAGGIALAFNPRTTGLAFVYRVLGGSLQLTLTNLDGEAPTDVVVSTAGNPLDPAIAVTPTGLAIAWRDDDAGEGALGPLVLALVGDDGDPEPQDVVSDPGELCGRPALIAVPGGLALAYAADNAGVVEVRLRILDAAGVPGPARVLGPGQRPATAALPLGVGVAWQQVNGEESDVLASAQCLVP